MTDALVRRELVAVGKALAQVVEIPGDEREKVSNAINTEQGIMNATRNENLKRLMVVIDKRLKFQIEVGCLSVLLESQGWRCRECMCMA
jgi:hypothetical protein